MTRRRALTLVAGALVCATLAGLVAHLVYRGVPGNMDGRCVVDSVLVDPAAPASLVIAALSAAIGWTFAMYTLRGVRLISAVPIVLVATVSAAAISAWLVPELSPPLALAIGVGTMFWIRRGSP